MNNLFLNIIILFSPNYNNEKHLGSVIKSINLMDQFILFYKSIKKQLHSVKYDISIVHWKDFNKEDLDKLKEMDVNLIKTNSTDINECSLERYNVKTRIKGTHRLIAETDMILLNDPKFNWNVDFQKMYDNVAKVYPYPIMKKIFNVFNIKNKYIKNYHINNNLFISYNVKKIHKNKLFPHFNNGLTLIKEEFSTKFYNKVISLERIKKRNNLFHSKYHHFFEQVLYGLVILELTDNWEPFEPGINYILKVWDVEKFEKKNISLLHYCGCGSGELVKQKFPEYF